MRLPRSGRTCAVSVLQQQSPEKVYELLPDSDEEEGLRQALASLRAGKGRTVDEVRRTIDATLER